MYKNIYASNITVAIKLIVYFFKDDKFVKPRSVDKSHCVKYVQNIDAFAIFIVSLAIVFPVQILSPIYVTTTNYRH